jgi:hypothetical protein
VVWRRILDTIYAMAFILSAVEVAASLYRSDWDLAWFVAMPFVGWTIMRGGWRLES